MSKKFLAILLALSMLLSMAVMAIPASAASTEPKVTSKGYLLSVHAGSTTANGLSTVFLISDGTFIIFDGGGSNYDAKHLYEQLCAIAAEHNLPEVVVSLWVVTHAHGDHFGFFGSWGNYKDKVKVKEFWFNAWSNSGTNKTYMDQIKSFYPNTPVNKVYAGEEYRYADAELLVLYAADSTNEKNYNQSKYGTAHYTDHYGTNGSTGTADFNDSSYIINVTIGDTTIMMTGDAGWVCFEDVYNSGLRSEMDVDIFQVPHHGVGSASEGAKYGTVNNKHLEVISPDAIIVPSGRTVTNMVLSGSRAVREKVTQLDGTKDYDGLYGLYRKFGIVEAAGGDGQIFATEADHWAKRTDGDSYWIAGWLNPSDYENSKSAQCFFVDMDESINYCYPESVYGVTARVDVEAGLQGSGIRFTSRVTPEVLAMLQELQNFSEIKGYTFGTTVFLAESAALVNGRITDKSLKAAGQTYVDIPAVNGIHTLTDDRGRTYYEFSAALVNIKTQNYGKTFAAVSYIECTLKSGEKVRVYGAYDAETQSATPTEVAFSMLTDLWDAPTTVPFFNYRHSVNTTYVKQDNKFQPYKEQALGTTMYSAYSSEQRTILAKYLK